MVKYIGRQINVGFGKETTRGTAVSIGAWMPKTDLSFDDKSEKIVDESAIGVIADARNSFLAKLWAEWDLSGNVEINSFWYLLLAVMGTLTSAESTTGSYLHEFTLKNDNQNQSLTVWVNDPVEWDVAFPLAMVESLTINAEEWQQVTFTVSIKSKKGESTTHTVTYPADYRLLSRDSIFKLATNLAGLSSADALYIKSFEITIEKNLEADYCLWSQEPNDFINKQVSITGSFTAIYEDEATYKDVALSEDKKALRFQLIDTAQTIGLSDNPTITIDLPYADMTEWSKSQGNDEVVTQTVGFKALYSVTDESMLNIDMINTKSSY